MTQVLRILTWPNEKLHEKCEDVTQFDEPLKILGDSLLVTMKAKNGVGLAAPQVGVLLNVIAVWANPTNPLILVNPKVVKLTSIELDISPSAQFEVNEGCLSVPGYFEKRKRSNLVYVSYKDVKGESHVQLFEGLEAFVVQHEMDHLEGKLFIDDLSQLKKDIVRRKVQKATR